LPAPTNLSSNLDHLAELLAVQSVAVMDFETSGVKTFRDQIAGLGVYFPDTEHAFYINVGHATLDHRYLQYSEQQLALALTSFLTDPGRHLIAHNASFELRFLLRLGLNIRCRVSCSMIHTHRTDENLRDRGKERVAHYHTDVSYGLKALTVVYFDEQPPTIMEAAGGTMTTHAAIHSVATYCVLDCYNTWRLYDRAAQIIDQDPPLRTLTDSIDDPNMVILARMMGEGILIDPEGAAVQRDMHDQAIQHCREAIWNLTGTTWALETPRDILRLLRHLNIPEDVGYNPFYVPMFDNERDRRRYELTITDKLMPEREKARPQSGPGLVLGISQSI
jgi:DNA polymerase I-like protein with 3'-5' exonuclease and polymerase domains